MPEKTESTEIEKFEYVPIAPIGDNVRLKAFMTCEPVQHGLMEILPSFSRERDPEKHVARLVAQATLVFLGQRKLRECTQASVLDSMMRVAETGLSLARQSGEAYLVPFKTARGMTCTFMPGYRGLIKLAHQTGGVKSVDAVIVYKGEEFKYWENEQGPHIHHEPNLDGERNDKDIIYIYARIQTVMGATLLTVMNRRQIEAIQRLSKCPNSPAWKDHWGEMGRKTVMKRGLKTVPQNTSDDAVGILERAIELDNRAGGFVDADTEELEQARQKALDADWKQRVGSDDGEQGTVEPADPAASASGQPALPDGTESDE